MEIHLIKVIIRKLAITALFVWAYQPCYSQIYLETAQRKVGNSSITIILPTKDNMIKLVNLSAEEFKTTMKHYDYLPMQGNTTRDYIYANCDERWLDTDGRNIISRKSDTKRVYPLIHILTLTEEIWPKTLIQDLYESLEPYYEKVILPSGKEAYKIYDSNYLYFLIIGIDDDSVSIQCYRPK